VIESSAASGGPCRGRSRARLLLRVAGVALFVLAALLADPRPLIAPAALAGPPPEKASEKASDGFPGPEIMFDRLFGPETEQERKALAKVEVSLREERRFGEEAVKAYLAHLKGQSVRVTTRGNDVAYLGDLVETLRPRMRNADRYPTVRVYLADSDLLEARCFPGGHLVIFRGLLDAVESEAALAGVIGHELSHLDHGHQLRDLRRWKLAWQTFSGRQPPWSFDRFLTTSTIFTRMWTRPFEPEDEKIADRDGATWAYQAGYDPREMAGLLVEMHRRAAGAALPLPPFLKSHPPPLDRRRIVMDSYERLRRETPDQSLYVGKENLRRRIARARQQFPE
jgi:predicted Zn-dependent protease